MRGRPAKIDHRAFLVGSERTAWDTLRADAERLATERAAVTREIQRLRDKAWNRERDARRRVA
ncbi:MAG: hypothetical protein ACK5W7_04200 [Gemmatimonadaceae bacterium]|jgi:hypothetical protein